MAWELKYLKVTETGICFHDKTKELTPKPLNTCYTVELDVNQ